MWGSGLAAKDESHARNDLLNRLTTWGFENLATASQGQIPYKIRNICHLSQKNGFVIFLDKIPL